MTDNEYKLLMEAAHKRNAQFSKIDKANGFGTPENEVNIRGVFMTVRTAITAIEAGIKRDDWNCIAEAQDMLIDARARIDLFEKLMREGKI